MITRRALLRMVGTLVVGSVARALLPEPVRAQTTGFVGRVTHLVTGEPIADALISAGDRHALTDDQGWYVLVAPPGRYTVQAQAPDYIGMSHTLQPVTVALTNLDFGMIPSDPDPTMSREIDAQLMTHSQEVSPELVAQIMDDDEGVIASSFTSVPRTVRVLVRENPAIIDSPPVEIIELDFEEYLKGVVPWEMPPSWPTEALRAQAVAARSYATTNMRKHLAEGANVCSSVHCQVWKPTHYETTNQAVDATRGVAATYNGSIIYAFFHAHCGGHTENSEDVWVSALPYCRGVPCICGKATRWGHGVGMCQHGARAMALEGATHSQILAHYYQGTGLLAPQRGVLSGGNVAPTSGDRATTFVYKVHYYSDMGTPPPIANVIIDGRAETMRRESGSASTGWTYVYATTLPAGEHTYRFRFDDGHGHIAAEPAAGTYAGPTVSAAGSAPAPTLRPDITFATATDWQSGTLDGLAVVPETGALALASGRQQGNYTSPTLSPGALFVAYGLLWQRRTPGSSTISLQARTSADGAHWGSWRTLDGEDYVPGTRDLQSSPLAFGEARHIQFRATLTAGGSGQQPELRHLRLVFLDTREGPSSLDWDEPTIEASGQPAIISRAQWGANESWMTWPPEYRDIRALIVHHTVTSDGGVNPAAVVRAIYKYHAIDREWGDIGYNFLIDKDGRIYEGRYGGNRVVGRHASIYSTGSVGIAMIGNFHDNHVPPAMYNTLTTLTAYQCILHSLDPLGQTYLINRIVPTILGHRDVGNTLCPGQHAYALMGSIRSDTKTKMAPPPPTVSLSSPVANQLVRGVIKPSVSTGGIVTRMEYYVDNVLQAVGGSGLVWKWNTALQGDGARTLRVVAENAGGRASASVTVQVDNTPPSGTVSAPAWTSAWQVPISVASADAVSMGLSNGWAWEAEDLHYQGPGQIVWDPAASGNRALRHLAGAGPGVSYGPYICQLPSGHNYHVVFSLRTNQNTSSAGMATLDVADGAGGVTYAVQAIAGDDFGSGAYQEFVLGLAYPNQAASCSPGGPGKGLEFRTWFSGAGNLWLDRVQVFTAPQPLADTLWCHLDSTEGQRQVVVRLVDAAGNATNYPLTIGVDRTAPEWAQADGSGWWVRDRLSGLDVNQIAWSQSHDGGHTWGAWQTLSSVKTMGIRMAVLLYTNAPTGSHVRYRARDIAGNESISPALPTGIAPTLGSPEQVTFVPLARR